MDKDLIKNLKKGCTVFGLKEATAIRKLQKAHPDWITIVDDMKELKRIVGGSFDSAPRKPYFGAILRKGGRKNIDAVIEILGV